jgi:hypothetical protein
MSNESSDVPTKIFIKKKKLVIRKEQATAQTAVQPKEQAQTAVQQATAVQPKEQAQPAVQPKEQQPKEQAKEQQIEQYIAQLSPQERIVLRIAQEHLETSFDIEKSIGYKHFCKK